MYSLPFYKTQPNPQYNNRSSFISNYHPLNTSYDISMTREQTHGDSFPSLRLNNKANSDQGLNWDNFGDRNNYEERTNILPYQLERPNFLSYNTESFIENQINYTKKSVQEPSLFTKTLWNLRNNNRKSNSNGDKDLSSGSKKGSNRDSSLSRKKKSSNILGLNEIASTRSERELLNALERSRDSGPFAVGQSIKRKSSAKTAPFLSTPKMPWKESGDFDVQASGTRTTKTTGNISSTISKTPRAAIHQEHIVTVTENRAKEIGIATFNVTNGEIVISQISDNHTYVNSLALIFRFYPIEIIFPQTQENSLFFLNVQKRFKNSGIKLIKKTFFDETKGCFIYSQSATNHIADLDSKYLGFAALNALCSYLEFARGIVLFYPSLKISFHYNEHFMLIDLSTIESLELLLNNKTKTSQNSLIASFECQTVGGSRLLRASLLQPLNNKAKIEERFDAGDEIIEQRELIADLKKVLKSFDQCDNVSAKFIQNFNESDHRATKQLYMNIVSLFHMLTGIEGFLEVLDHFKSPLFATCFKTLSDKRIAEIISDIKSKLHVEPKAHGGNEKFKQKLYYLVKNETNEFLDLARVYYTRLTSEVYQLHQQYQQVLQTRDLQLLNQDTRGFCLFVNHNLLTKHSLDELEAVLDDRFVQVTKRGKGCLVKTKLMESLNNRIKESCTEILNQTQKTLKALLETIHSRITIIFNISEAIAQIDMILAFANYKLNSLNTHCRPNFNNELSTLAINQSRHPVLEKNSFVVNDYIFTPNNPASIVFGRPGSGKTVYVKQIALLCIVAQIGCPIPCESATLLVYDRLFARIGTNDNLEMNESSLYFELNQCYNIFHNVVEKSSQIKFRTLVISDGFAKSTNYEESFAITAAFIEQFLLFNNLNLVLTAYDPQIMAIAAKYKFINCVQMKSETIGRKITHHYKAEKVDFHSLQDNLVKDIELMNMPKEFRADFEEMMGVLSTNQPIINRNEELEEKYLEKVKEFLMCYSQIIMKPQSPEEKTAELLNLKRMYFKDIVSNK